MKNKILYGLNFLWCGFIAFTLPVCIGWIYMDITGHSKGYSYDLGDEKSVSVFLGCVELLIWIILALPSYLRFFWKTDNKLKIISVLIFSGLFILCINLIGGWNEFLKCFNI
ncbi:MAG: hypothetical protein NC205_02685 [Prevotella sp.]|nr:hypothetical protein [Alistipes senegalensis]MCM1357475.1 hypothetical protein [Prevotella sp.]MCM1473673.1 hypothetical protein [Muribaculaceae bacterium]